MHGKYHHIPQPMASSDDGYARLNVMSILESGDHPIIGNDWVRFASFYFYLFLLHFGSIFGHHWF